MAFLKLLADLMKFLMRAPTRVISTLNEFILTRAKTKTAFTGVGKEVKEVGKIGKFFRFLGIAVLYIVIIAVLIGIVVGLWYLNDALNLERVLGGPWPIFRPYWLPLLFLLFLVSCYVGVRLLRSLGPDRLDVEFDDIEAAWSDAQAALIEAGIVFKNVPVFLVLGRNASNLHAILSASRLTFAVQQIPLKTGAPVQVYANRQAVYIVAPDASLLGRQAELLYETSVAAEPPPPKSAAPSVFEEPELPPLDPTSTTEPPATVADPFPAVDNLLADPSAAPVGLLTEPETPVTMPWQAAGHPRMPALLNRTDEVDRYKARLGYLARRIARDRAPYCPLNGILLLIPFNALATEEDGSQLASICEADLEVLHDTARTRCPVIVLVTDLETAPGYTSLAEKLDADRRVRLFGQDVPLVPDLKPTDIPLMLSGSVRHFSAALSQWIFRLLRVEQSAKESAAVCIAANWQLFELLGSIRRREAALERILARIAQPPSGKSGVMLAGYYVAATGMNPDTEQAFVPGIFQQLVQNQNAVAWTQDALTEEADFRRWTTYGYAALGLFIIAMAAIIYTRWQMLRW